MMASKIGTVQFHTLKRDPRTPGERAEVVTRPHVSGTAIKKVGKKGDPFRMVGVVDLLVASRVAFIASLQALRDKAVTVVDDFGASWTNVFVLAVDHDTVAASGAVGGQLAGAAEIILTATFTCIDTSVS